MTDLRQLLEAATPGPWHRGEGVHSNIVLPPFLNEWVGVAGDRLDVPVFSGQTSNRTREEWEADAALIAAFRNAAPYLLDVVDAARETASGCKLTENGKWCLDCVEATPCSGQALTAALTNLDKHLGAGGV